MIIFWRGFGFLIAILIFVGYSIGRIGAEKIWGSPLSETYRPGAELVGMLIAAALVYLLHAAIRANETPRTVIDKATGQEIELRAKHDLFFVPIKFWPYILCVLGICFFFQK